MVIQTNHSQITAFKTEFDLCHSTSIRSKDCAQVTQAMQKMEQLKERILKAMQDTPQNAGRTFQEEISPDAKRIGGDVQRKLSEMHGHLRALSPARAAQDLATGFGNLSANCWANSFLSMVVCVPHLREAYMTVANHYTQGNRQVQDQIHGGFLSQAMTEYDTALAQRRPVSPQITQNVRLAFHHFFGHRDPVTRNEIFSQRSGAHEDAYEAMQMLMGHYEEIVRRQNPGNPALVPLYSQMETARHYLPVGEQRDAIPALVERNTYSRLGNDNASRLTCHDYQIFLDLQNRGHLPFPELLLDYFHCTATAGSETAKYLLQSGKIQDFQLIREERRFLAVPDEFLLTIKRFGFNQYGQSYKITTPVAINRIIQLPPEATTQNTPLVYTLDSFVVHSGGTGGGHYICYKKIDGVWVEANDSSVRFVNPHEIDQILHGQRGPTFTSYMHHYSRVPNALPVNASAPLSPDEFGSLCHAIWLNDQMPDLPEYGKMELERHPERLYQITLPWLIGRAGTPLLEQMNAVRKIKQEIAEEQAKETQLFAFLSKVHDSCLSNQELKNTLLALPQQIQWDLHGQIYRAHKTRLGEAHVHREEYRGEYGRVALETAESLRDTLLQAEDNSVKQLAIHHQTQRESLQCKFEKEQLEAFRELLLYPSSALTQGQLAKAFERLEIREETRERLYGAIWVGHGSQPIDNDGKNRFTADPRCVLEIRNRLIAEPSACAADAHILDQLIASLVVIPINP